MPVTFLYTDSTSQLITTLTVVFSVIYICCYRNFVCYYVCLLSVKSQMEKKFNNVIQKNMKDFCDVHNSPQAISISSKECTPCDSDYIYSLSTKVLATAVKDDSYIRSNRDIIVTAESSF